MSTQWLTYQTFRLTQELLESISSLSIQIKLSQVKLNEAFDDIDSENARKRISRFLIDLEKNLVDSASNSSHPKIGSNSRQREFAHSFFQAKNDRKHFHSKLFRATIGEVQELLVSNKIQDQEVLLDCLSELRVLLETCSEADNKGILGDF
jgi:hypothetical protein